MSSASSRAPAIQPVHKSMSRNASSGSTSPITMSAIWTRPPGLRTRTISAIARCLSGYQIEHAVGDHDIDGPRIDAKSGGIAITDLDIRQSASRGAG